MGIDHLARVLLVNRSSCSLPFDEKEVMYKYTCCLVFTFSKFVTGIIMK
jgi:hypothetical protein